VEIIAGLEIIFNPCWPPYGEERKGEMLEVAVGLLGIALVLHLVTHLVIAIMELRSFKGPRT
jgi:hypothetical protein